MTEDVKAAVNGAPVTAAALLLENLRKQQANRLWLSVGSGVIATALLVIAWWQIAALVHRVLFSPEDADIYGVLLAVSAAAIPIALWLRAIFLYWQDKLAQEASTALRHGLRQRILAYWRIAPYQGLVADAPSTHASRLLEDVDALDGYISRYWPQQQLMLLSPLLILLAIAYINWLVALLMLLSAPLIPLFMSLIGMGAEQLNQRHVQQRQRLAGHFFDRLQKLGTIKRLQAEAQVAKEVVARSDRYRQLVMKTLRLAFLSSAVLEFFSSVAIAAVAIYIGFSLFGAIDFGPAQQLTLGSGLFILALAPEFFQPLRQFAQSYHDKAAALAAAEQLSPVLKQYSPERTQCSPELTRPSESSGTLASSQSLSQTELTTAALTTTALTTTMLRVVSGDNKLVTSALNLTLSSGQLLLIRGPSGVGKTTLLNTLAKLLPPAGGHISWTDTKVTSAFYMRQQPWIVRGSIRDNLKLLGSQASDQVLLQVLQQLGLANLCASVKDLDRPLSERGEGVSGGQLQRLALARAFLQPYQLLFLDEPTASLDSQSRQYLAKALRLLKMRSMLVVVSHDPALIALADQQLVLQEAEHAVI
ncbi:MAG: ABC transporter ATP-binding protein/permease [Alishewanella aestuarii]